MSSRSAESLRRSCRRSARRSGGFLAVVAVALALGCQSYGVRTDRDDTLDFDGMQRFHFEAPPVVEGGDPFADNSLLRKRVRSAIEAALGDLGYQAVETPEAADFLVTYQVLLEDEVRVDGETIGTGIGVPPRFGGVYSSTRVNAYQEATLVIDVLLPGSRDLAWRGWGQRMLSTRDRTRSEEQLRDGVRAILSRFPSD